MPTVRLVAASGHLTDDPDRPIPRFPEESVPRVTAEIRRRLQDWGLGPGDLLICGGARGGDLVAAEQALALGARVRLCLASAREDFVARSVERLGTNWTQRFHAVAASADVRVQAAPPSGEEFDAANRWMIDQARAEAAVEKYALVVWDGRPGDSSGGTAGFAELAARAGLPIFGVDPTPRPSADRQWAPGPKKLLALDGGGVRGVLTLGTLQRIEEQLRAWAQRDDMVLADYFDYIGGTSTGAIIATGLSLGWPVETLVEAYRSLAAKVFRLNWVTPFVSLHPTGPLEEQVNALLGKDRRLGDTDLKTLLLLVLHNSDTDSPWPLSNCPSARFNRPERRLSTHPDRGTPHEPDRNLDLRLGDLVRGSTAAPLYFAPQDIRVGSRTVRFQDGGVTPYNNPALLLFTMATQREYNVRWEAGQHRMLVVSVGTGLAAAGQRKGWTSLSRVQSLPATFMNGASVGQDYLCRVAGRTTFGFPVDNEVGRVPSGLGLFTYARYNVNIGNLAELRAELAVQGADSAQLAWLDSISPRKRRKLMKLNAKRCVDDLYRLGRLGGELVRVQSHFAGFPP